MAGTNIENDTRTELSLRQERIKQIAEEGADQIWHDRSSVEWHNARMTILSAMKQLLELIP